MFGRFFSRCASADARAFWAVLPASVAQGGKRPIPLPRMFLGSPMTVERFLKRIGRGAEGVASKFSSWDDLFVSTQAENAAKGISVHLCRHIFRYTEKYLCGEDPRAPQMRKVEKRKAAKERLAAVALENKKNASLPK